MIDHTNKSRSLDRVLDILGHSSRRRILFAVWNNNTSNEECAIEAIETEDKLDLSSIELYHNHLPKLAETDYIEWDKDTNTIRKGPNFEEIAPLFQLMHDHQDELPYEWP